MRFNAFTILKYLNFVHAGLFEMVPLAGSAFLLLNEIGFVHNRFMEADLSVYLAIFRKIDMELKK